MHGQAGKNRGQFSKVQIPLNRVAKAAILSAVPLTVQTKANSDPRRSSNRRQGLQGAFSPFFGLKARFLSETVRNLGL
jgi:hypothetical protein